MKGTNLALVLDLLFRLTFSVASEVIIRTAFSTYYNSSNTVSQITPTRNGCMELMSFS